MLISTPLRPGSCYETAMTRKFYHGRTETMRPCTNEAVKWCTTMMDPTCDVSVCAVEALYCNKTTQVKEMEAVFDPLTFFQADAKRKAMLLAFHKHNKLMAEAQEGNGLLTFMLFLNISTYCCSII